MKRMNEHGLDAMIYAWLIMKEKEENKMEGIYVGRITRSKVDKGSADLLFIDHRQDVSHLDSVIKYDDTAYCLVPSDDILINNDELLKLRDEVKRLTDECNDWKVRYSDVNNELFQKGLAYGTLETTYKNEKIAGEMLLKDRDALKEKVEKLEAELMEIKTARTLREAYISGVEKGCEGLREERDRWKSRWNSVVTDISNTLSANGIELTVEDVLGDVEWKVGFDIPELNEAKAKVADLEKKLEAAKSKETFWRGRKEEEEDYHHYWLHTFDRAVKQAAEKGIHIGVRGNDDECNAGIVTLDNMKAEELEKQVVALEKTNKNLNQKIGAADNALEYWNNTYNDIVIAGKKVGVKIDIKGKKPDDNAGFVYVTNEKAKDLESQVVQMEDANQELRKRISAAEDEMEKIKDTAFWRNTYYSAVEKAKEEGVTIVIQGMNSDHNVALIKVMNHRTASLERQIKRLEDDNSAKAEAVVAAKDRGDYWKGESDAASRYYRNLQKSYDRKWQAMLDTLKDKGVEVIYMGEEDGKPIVDVKIPAIDILRKDYVVRGQTIDDLKKELEALKSRTLDKVEIRLSYGDIMWTYCDGFVHLSSKIDGIISADQITTGHINCLCKNHVAVGAESISHGTIPTCKSCAHYMHNPSRFAHDWCYMPIPKEGGAGYIRRLSTEEAESPACSDYKARKE